MHTSSLPLSLSPSHNSGHKWVMRVWFNIIHIDGNMTLAEIRANFTSKNYSSFSMRSPKKSSEQIIVAHKSNAVSSQIWGQRVSLQAVMVLMCRQRYSHVYARGWSQWPCVLNDHALWLNTNKYFGLFHTHLRFYLFFRFTDRNHIIQVWNNITV